MKKMILLLLISIGLSSNAQTVLYECGTSGRIVLGDVYSISSGISAWSPQLTLGALYIPNGMSFGYGGKVSTYLLNISPSSSNKEWLKDFYLDGKGFNVEVFGRAYLYGNPDSYRIKKETMFYVQGGINVESFNYKTSNGAMDQEHLYTTSGGSELVVSVGLEAGITYWFKNKTNLTLFFGGQINDNDLLDGVVGTGFQNDAIFYTGLSIGLKQP